VRVGYIRVSNIDQNTIRQLDGIAAAKQRGVYAGRKPALTDEQARRLRERAAAGERKSTLAKEFGISRQTVYSYLRGEAITGCGVTSTAKSPSWPPPASPPDTVVRIRSLGVGFGHRLCSPARRDAGAWFAAAAGAEAGRYRR
jgi:DNA-binding CsgD family transcriptional regulator